MFALLYKYTITMTFFRRSDIDNFAQYTLGQPNDIHIYTYNDILELTKISGNTAWVRPLTVMLQKACGDNIGTRYYDSIKTLFSKHPDEMDMVIITNTPFTTPKTRRDNTLLTQIEDPGSIVLGLLITQKNECIRYPNVHTINLICSIHQKGSFLMGLYLYTIKQRSLNLLTDGRQLGLLELANGFINIGGLCMYSKYGFTMDYDLYGKNCFPDYDNLPMQVDVKNITPEQIISIYKGIGVFNKPPICGVKMHQILLGMCLNLRRFNELKQKQHVTQFFTSSGYMYDYKKMWEMVGKNKTILNQQIENLLHGTYDDTTKHMIAQSHELIVAPVQQQKTLKRTIKPALDTNVKRIRKTRS